MCNLHAGVPQTLILFGRRLLCTWHGMEASEWSPLTLRCTWDASMWLAFAWKWFPWSYSFQDLYGHGLSNAPPVDTWREWRWVWNCQIHSFMASRLDSPKDSIFASACSGFVPQQSLLLLLSSRLLLPQRSKSKVGMAMDCLLENGKPCMSLPFSSPFLQVWSWMFCGADRRAPVIHRSASSALRFFFTVPWCCSWLPLIALVI